MRKTIITLLLITLFLPACSDAKVATQSRTVQEPVVAGMFYPADPATLKAEIRGYLKAAPQKTLPGHLMGLIAPHAGYRYSGLVAAHAFKQLEGRRYATVVVLAPSHRVPLTGAALSTRDVYRTPLGDIPIDTKAAKNLIAKHVWAHDDQRPYAMEHSLEVELPFLQSVLGTFKLVPVIVGTHDKTTLDAIAAALNDAFPGDDVLFVASTDLSHYMPYDKAVEADKRTLAFITDGDPDEFWRAERDGRVLACGAAPTYIAMKIWKLRGGGSIDVLEYLNSGDTAGDRSRVVGYGALALSTGSGIRDMEPGKDKSADSPDSMSPVLGPKDLSGFSLTPSQKNALVKLARETVVAHVEGKKLPPIETADPLFKRDGAVFVTLTKNGDLRGCIGHIIAREPLIENVRNMAIAAASSDARFPPVRPDELEHIHVEVSVLTPPQPLHNPLEVDVGVDGLIIERGFNRGVLLPQVPIEQGWNKDEYLANICRKAGMEPTCWKTAKLEKFQAIIFGE